MSKLEELLIRADLLIRKREYRQVIAAIQPFEKEWTANHAKAPDVAPKLLFLLGSAYGGAGIRDKALATLLEAARMSSGDTALLAAIMEVTADVYFENGDIAHALVFSRDSLALVCADLLSKAQSRSPTPRTERPRVAAKIAGYLEMSSQWDEARAMFAIAREIYEAHGDFLMLGQIFDAEARMARLEGDIVKARKFVAQALLAKRMARDPTEEQSYAIIFEEKGG